MHNFYTCKKSCGLPTHQGPTSALGRSRVLSSIIYWTKGELHNVFPEDRELAAPEVPPSSTPPSWAHTAPSTTSVKTATFVVTVIPEKGRATRKLVTLLAVVASLPPRRSVVFATPITAPWCCSSIPARSSEQVRFVLDLMPSLATTLVRIRAPASVTCRVPPRISSTSGRRTGRLDVMIPK